jgi:quinol monooxygenase YgiN
MTDTNNAEQSLIVTAFWQVNPGEESTIAGLLKQFLPQAQKEPGVEAFQIHQNTAKPGEFFFYEVFAGEAAFAEHQQTAHFKSRRRCPSLRSANACNFDIYRSRHPSFRKPQSGCPDSIIPASVAIGNAGSMDSPMRNCAS